MRQFFSHDYFTARNRFRDAATRSGWHLEAVPIGSTGPGGEELTVDIACSQHPDPEKVLVVSSGLHGVEGLLGSAVQLALLKHWGQAAPIRCVLLHALNPFGFAWLRRFDQNNVDPNRNFLLMNEQFHGAPHGYAELNRFLNPCSPPSRWEPFLLKALWLIARHGMPALCQAIAAGQYEFPQGLFFGGHEPSSTQQVLRQHMPQWLHGAKHVVHLDIHSGLGQSGNCQLLIDYPLQPVQRDWLTEWFGPDSYEACDSSDIAYDARGGFGKWCVHQQLAAHYLFACAEFGTYSPVAMLSGLRAENRAFHWGDPQAESTAAARRRLAELFCPRSPKWRLQVVQTALRIVAQAQQGLTKITSP